MSGTDKNIDHRRVPNLMKFFERNNASVSITTKVDDYKFGNIIYRDLGKRITHIGLLMIISKHKLDLLFIRVML